MPKCSKKCVKKGVFASVFFFCKCVPVPVLFLRDMFGCSAVLVSLGVVLFVHGPSVPFPSLPRISRSRLGDGKF